MAKTTVTPDDGEYTIAVAITPSDAADLGTYARAIYVGGTGDIKLTTTGGSTVTFTNVPAGIFKVTAQKVFSTGTDATGLFALQ